jgi:hypothetical protein
MLLATEVITPKAAPMTTLVSTPDMNRTRESYRSPLSGTADALSLHRPSAISCADVPQSAIRC